MKVLTIFGTRPEAIKLAPVIKELEMYPKVTSRACITAQHRQMLDQALSTFKIEPDYDFNIMQDNQSLFDVTVQALIKLEKIFEQEKPDIVLVQGDTTTAFIASLAGYYLKIKVGHIEAGLRSFDKFNPFPEEINRRLADALSDFYFVPTIWAKENLIRENIWEEKIFITGNTIIDALFMITKKEKNDSQVNLKEKFLRDFGISIDDNHRIVLVTGHRRESFGQGFENICQGIEKIVTRNKDVEVIYPVHLNPNVQKPVKRILEHIDRIHLVSPLDYFSFVWLMNKSFLILTDSGGIVEEAPSLGKPVLIMRKKTERPEAIEAGTAKLVGTDAETIFKETQKLLHNKSEYSKMIKAVNPYGDGKAAQRIVKILHEKL